jgi:polyferredoxin
VSKGKRAGVIPQRRWVQVAFLVLVVAMGWQFVAWVDGHADGQASGLSRPPGVEGFLPISALMSARLWVAGQGVHPVHPAGLAILLAIVAMSAVLAKSFCSHVCPVGTVSEAVGRIGERLLGRSWQLPRFLDVPLRGLKYLLLVFFVWATWVVMDLAAVRAFLDSPYNRVADVKMLLFFTEASRLTVAVLGVLVVGSLLVRDVWCRYLCPYGALLGIVGRLAPLKVTRDHAACTDCHQCTKVCPARLPVHAMRRVASVECTSCQDCVAACPVTTCLAVRPVSPTRWRPLLGPAAAIGLAVAVYLGVTTGFRLAGHWRGSVSEAEYARRIVEIDSPVYTHVGGMAASESSGGELPPVSAHAER